VFDINDFDETLPGPWEWDVKRLAASMLIGARDNGFSTADQERIVLETAAQYRTSLARFAAMKNLDVWYAHTEITALAERVSDEIGRTGRRNLKRNIARARRRDSLHAFSKLTHEAGGTRRFVSDLPLLVPLAEFDEEARDDLSGRLNHILRTYQRSLQHDRRVLLDQFHLVDVARKVVGVGSVGTDAWIALFVGRDDDDHVRQLRDWKGSVVVEAMRPRGMAAYGRVCGATLARAHARSGDRIAIAAYLGSGTAFDRAILRFSEAYAEQNARDHAALVEAVSSGRVVAHSDL
jgi:uncharacterized protein (DUF2252 family)